MLSIVESICSSLGITLEEVAYIGDDINCKELLENVGVSACPDNVQAQIKLISNILQLSKKGGDGVVREFIKIILGKV
jgi:N-acylneuraminate cytidylyltransferase